MGDRPVCLVVICPGPDLPGKPTRFAPLLFALWLVLVLGLGLGLEANRVGLQECGQIRPGANSTPGKSGRGQADLIPHYAFMFLQNRQFRVEGNPTRMLIIY
jgi:hypothetical protein